MTHVMAKGANISLTAAAVRAVLCWNATPGSPDVDASALLLGSDGKVRSDADFVFYNQPSHPSGVVRYLPKQQAAGGGGEVSDRVEVDLARLPSEVERVVLAASAEGGAFPAVARLRLLLHDTGTAEGAGPIAEFAITDAGDVSALVAAELYRRDGAWKFRAVGQGYAAGLVGLATDFGITVEEEENADAPEPELTLAPVSAPEPHPAPVDPRDEPGTYTLAPAVPMPSAPPSPPPLPPQQPTYAHPQPAQPAPTGYGYPQQQQPGYGYPPQQPPPGYGYPPPPAQPPQHLVPQPVPQQAPVALPPQGPQFQPR